MTLEELQRNATGLKLRDFVARFAGYYLGRGDSVAAFTSVESTDILDFSRKGAPLGGHRSELIKLPQEGESDLRVTIGRTESCDVVLVDASVSGLHARLFISEGNCELTDLKSKNGTRLNGVLITPERPTLVKVGDILHFGNIPTVLLDAETLFDLV